ncbi:hypothetical protein [Roseibium alexandrii]|nr:hypothetical protein [Roseibium alexandrii]
MKLDTSALSRGPNRVKVGFPAGKAGADIVQRAIWNHFGTSGGGWGGPIPERPFLHNAMADHRSEYRGHMRKSAAKILKGQTALQTVLSKLGVLAQGHIQGEITNLSSPPNSPVTVERKGSSNPLIDTGEMRQAVTWKVDDA